MIRICPKPPKWIDIYEELKLIARQQSVQPPLRPLILSGWVHSSDAQKIERWEEHVTWAKAHGAQALIDSIAEADYYCAHELTYPREWDWSMESIPVAIRPSDQELDRLLKLLQESWGTVAAGFAQQTIPASFSGKKARTLNVKLLATEPLPPWGTWGLENVGLHSQKFTSKVKFTVFRKSVNLLIAPHKVDHIEFFYKNDSKYAK